MGNLEKTNIIGTDVLFEDAKMCIVHHATSKIGSIYDLEKLHTFGFRGEALSSIASVSKVTLKTKIESSVEGIQLKIEEGKIISHKEIAQKTPRFR